MRTGGACIPPSRAQPAPAQIVRHGFKVLRTRSRAGPEPFPNAAEIGREIKFLTVDAAFGRAPCQGGAFQWVQGPPGDSLQPEAIGAVMEVTKWLKPSISVSRIGDSASVQAATRVNAEQTSKTTMCRPTRGPFRGRLIRLGRMSET